MRCKHDTNIWAVIGRRRESEVFVPYLSPLDSPKTVAFVFDKMRSDMDTIAIRELFRNDPEGFERYSTVVRNIEHRIYNLMQRKHA